MATSDKRQETDHTVPGLGMLELKREGEAVTFDDLVDGYLTRAHLKPLLINGENLNLGRGMATLTKIANLFRFHVQRLNEVAA